MTKSRTYTVYEITPTQSITSTDSITGTNTVSGGPMTIWDAGGKNMLQIASYFGGTATLDLQAGLDSDGVPYFSTVGQTVFCHSCRCQYQCSQWRQCKYRY